MAYEAAEERYDRMVYRFCGRSGLALPTLSLGLWHNFGDPTPGETQRTILRTAFDLGITHFDLANNYGPPYGAPSGTSARSSRRTSRPTGTSCSSRPRPAGTCGRARTGRAAARASTCWRAWTRASAAGPRLRRHLLLASVRPGHAAGRDDGRAGDRVHQGKALYAGISSYSPGMTREAARIMRELGCRAHPPAVLQHAEPVDRRRPAGHAGGRRASAASRSRRWLRAC